MRLSKLALLVCMAAGTVIAQDLAPEVLLLSRIKTHLRSEFSRLPNYTCLETIERFHKKAARDAKFRPQDKVRLEVGYSNHREWYAWPGSLTFTVDNPASLAGSQGLIADGVFAIRLHNLFIADSAVFTPRGEEDIGGRKAVKFDFRFPSHTNITHVSVLGGSGWVNEEGSIWADSQSLDLLRLDGRATEIPPFLPLGAMEYSVTFARTHIGESDALLAQDVSLRMAHNAGFEDYDQIAFTHCQVFQTSSALSFEAEPVASALPAPAPAAPASQAADTSRTTLPAESERNVPAQLRVTIEVTSSISNDDEAGRLIEGRVVGDVRRKGKIVLENGAPVRGRIRHIERYQDGHHFIVGLEFTEVRAQGVPLRFYADLAELVKWRSVEPALRKEMLFPNSYGSSLEITLPELPGIASFFVEGKTFVLPPGLRTVWQTRALPRGAD